MHRLPWHQDAASYRFARALWLVLALGMALALPGARAEVTVEVIPLNYMDARDAAEIINALYANEVRAVAFPPTNALLVNMTPSGAATQATMPAGPRQLPAGSTFPGTDRVPFGMEGISPYGRAPFGQPMGPMTPPGVGPGFGPGFGPGWSPAPQMPATPPVPATPMNNPEAPPTP